MRRALLAIAVVAGALGACGNDSEPEKTIAILRAVAVPEANSDAFFDELATAGWKEGDNLTVLARATDEAYADPADKLAEWKREDVDLVVALSTPSTMAADDALPDVPILFAVNDPIGAGLVTNARTPEGHMSGVSFRVPPDRTLDILRSLGGVRTVGLLYPGDDAAAEPVRAGLQEAAGQLKLNLVEASFADPDGVDAAVRSLVDAGAEAIVLVSSPATVEATDALTAATSDIDVPVIASNTTYPFAAIVLAPDSTETYRQLARQVARVLDGTPISDIPVEDPGSFKLTIHQDVADRIGLQIPRELLDRADEVTG